MLNNTIVCCAPYGQLPLETVRFLFALRDRGAMLILQSAQADICLTRASQAEAAYRELTNHPEREWVFFLDADMWSSPLAIERLQQVSIELERVLGARPSVSGLYVNRHLERNVVAAWKVRGTDPIDYVHPEASTHAKILEALTGLGAFLMPARNFVEHVGESERVSYPKPGDSVPIVCESHILSSGYLRQFLEHSNLELDINLWQGEDFDFCCREYEHGRAVVVAPILFSHGGRMPHADIIFPGYSPEPVDVIVRG